MFKEKLLTVFFLSLCFFSKCLGQETKEVLELGIEKVKTIQPDHQHELSLNLEKGSWVMGEVLQQGINISLSVKDPKGKFILSQDLQKNVHTKEIFNFYTTEKGTYTVILQPILGNAVALDEDGNKFVWDGERRVPYETLFKPGKYSIKVTQRSRGTSLEEKIDDLFWFYNRDEHPGAAVAVVKKGKLVYKNGFGVANLEYNIPITPSTVFHMASVSKQFVGFALAKLHEEGKISLEDDIHKYIPELQIKEKVSIRQMLNHTSGLRDQWILAALSGWRMDDVITQNQLLKIIYRQEGLNFKPGERYSYSNSNYTLGAEIIHRVTGKTLREWTTENIFVPLQMNATFFYDDHEEIVKDRAYSYDDRSGKLKKSNLNFANVGATSLFTTAEDFSKWLMEFKNNNVFSEHIFDQVIQKGVLNDGKKTHYGLGLASGKYHNLPVIDHSGVDAGYRTFMMYFPEEELGIITLSNIASCNVINLAMKTANIYLGIEEKVHVDSKKEKQKVSQQNKTKEETLSKYEGTYYSPELEVQYQFFVKNGQLMASHKRLEDIVFSPLDKGVFKGDYWIFNHLKFIMAEDGSVKGFKVSNGGVNKLLFNKM